MKMQWNDGASITVECPNCNQPVEIAVRDLRAQSQVTCPREDCNTVFDTSGFVAAVEQAL